MQTTSVEVIWTVEKVWMVMNIFTVQKMYLTGFDYMYFRWRCKTKCKPFKYILHCGYIRSHSYILDICPNEYGSSIWAHGSSTAIEISDMESSKVTAYPIFIKGIFYDSRRRTKDWDLECLLPTCLRCCATENCETASSCWPGLWWLQGGVTNSPGATRGPGVDVWDWYKLLSLLSLLPFLPPEFECVTYMSTAQGACLLGVQLRSKLVLVHVQIAGPNQWLGFGRFPRFGSHRRAECSTDWLLLRLHGVMK